MDLKVNCYWTRDNKLESKNKIKELVQIQLQESRIKDQIRISWSGHHVVMSLYIMSFLSIQRANRFQPRLSLFLPNISISLKQKLKKQMLNKMNKQIRGRYKTYEKAVG